MGNCCLESKQQNFQSNLGQFSSPKYPYSLPHKPQQSQSLHQKQVQMQKILFVQQQKPTLHIGVKQLPTHHNYQQPPQIQLEKQVSYKESSSPIFPNNLSSLLYSKLQKHQKAQLRVIQPSQIHYQRIKKLQNQSPTKSLFCGVPQIDSKFTVKSSVKSIKQLGQVQSGIIAASSQKSSNYRRTQN